MKKRMSPQMLSRIAKGDQPPVPRNAKPAKVKRQTAKQRLVQTERVVKTMDEAGEHLERAHARISQLEASLKRVTLHSDMIAEKLRLTEARVKWHQRKSTAQARAWTINARKLSIASGMALNVFQPEPVNFMEEPPSMIPHESMASRIQAMGARTGRWSGAAPETKAQPQRAIERDTGQDMDSDT